MTRALGIDGGSSSLRAVLLGDGEPRRFSATGGTNLHEDPAPVVLARLRAVVEALGPADRVCIGTAGIDEPGDRERFGRVYAEAFGGESIEVVSDVEIIAACSEAPVRACVIAGTGSNVFALGPAGEAWAGGLDLPLTDWGSAAWIGEAALRRAAREAGGLSPPALGPAVLAALGLSWPDDWRSLKSARARMHKAELAGLARLVAARATDGCAASVELLVAAGDEVASAVEAVLGRVDPGGRGGALLTVGAVINDNDIVRRRVLDRFELLRPEGTVEQADAALGAARRALTAGAGGCPR